MKGNKILLLMALLLAVFHLACKKESPGTNWEITVKNAGGTVVNSARVVIYKSEADWRTESNSVNSGYTGSDGKITFSTLEIRNYYADIKKDKLTNWESGVYALMTDGKTTQTDFVIKETDSYSLSSASGKRWKIVKVDSSGTDVTSKHGCTLDNVYKLSKGNRDGNYLFDAGIAKCDGNENTFSGTWAYEPVSKELSFKKSGTTTEKYTILNSLGTDTIKATQLGWSNVQLTFSAQ